MSKSNLDEAKNEAPHVEDILKTGLTEIAESKTSEILESVKVKYLGKKGLLTSVLKSVGSLSPDQRKQLGQEVNQAKAVLDQTFDTRISQLLAEEENIKLSQEWLDVTLPVNLPTPSANLGSLHPLTKVRAELEEIFIGLGFKVVDGPEVETDFYNFEALNVPPWHPARDMQDTIWTSLPGILMRTQTSAIQVRSLLETEPPVRIVAPGRCFRYERLDATHEHTFYQMEGMMIDKNVGVGHLIYFMKTLLRKIYGFEPKIRLRPGYFPFVEPGFELDVWFSDRWLELLPCGLVHPEVLRAGGIDPEKWQGFAFGLGLSRLVMTRYEIDDIRHLQSGDLRFLHQF